ncbi:MAG: DUF4178 domain-containing protein [Bacteroidota bacterium]
MAQDVHCPTCGAPLHIRNRFVTTVTCEFCGSVSLVDGARLDPTGRSVTAVQVPSPLYLDATGRIGSRSFRVLGRLVYEYDGGFWTEWFLEVDGNRRVWMVEDEGAFSLLQIQPRVVPPPFDDITVGQTIQLGDLSVFVNEVDEATIVGAEGQLGAGLLPGEAIRYVDGTAGDNEISIEYGEKEVEVFVGRPIPRESVQIDDETY